MLASRPGWRSWNEEGALGFGARGISDGLRAFARGISKGLRAWAPSRNASPPEPARRKGKKVKTKS